MLLSGLHVGRDHPRTDNNAPFAKEHWEGEGGIREGGRERGKEEEEGREGVEL